ncbi:hypothetical protein [Fictibacillus fluitans]|uniref:Uncharacterized protein n=1 Tax=Fictibacillus fluitans TaxID=3058422 RepID=A0ABT8HZ29_9BACL|nr:hypothetical protein [Fictibacillus sp. NE201]MDN4526030.1 hypothetical protein [Fictibacillus sp. NE201]
MWLLGILLLVLAGFFALYEELFLAGASFLFGLFEMVKSKFR